MHVKVGGYRSIRCKKNPHEPLEGAINYLLNLGDWFIISQPPKFKFNPTLTLVQPYPNANPTLTPLKSRWCVQCANIRLGLHSLYRTSTAQHGRYPHKRMTKVQSYIGWVSSLPILVANYGFDTSKFVFGPLNANVKGFKVSQVMLILSTRVKSQLAPETLALWI